MNRYIVLHTHWDREWYFTTSDSLVLMDRTFKNIINELELYPNLTFCLDGQYSIIEEFLNINPELEQKISTLVSENRLQIGPWYTQTDTQLVDAESITRNLYYGMNKTKKRFEKVMMVGYLPDTFGFCHQLPEIYDVASINKAVFWRGADFTDGSKPYFNWQGAGGSISQTINLVGGYGAAKGFSSDADFIEHTLKAIIENYKQLGIDGEILIPVGNDQYEIKEDVPEIIAKINSKHKLSLCSSDYYTSIEEIFNGKEFDTYTCEFRKTAYTRLHKSIGSVRYDLKQENFEAEQLLINEVEPLFVIAKQFNVTPSINLLYTAWSLLFEGHAHDGICGCISDAVYEDMINRIKRAKEIGNSLKNLIMKTIANQLDLNDSEILLINQASFTKQMHELVVYSKYKYPKIKTYESQIIETKVIDSRDDALVETPTGNKYEHLDEMYCHKMLVQCEMNPFEIIILKLEEDIKNERTKTKTNAQITNGKMTVIEENGKVNIQFGNRQYKDVISFIDLGNDGDTYDFSPLIDAETLSYKFKSSTVITEGLKSTLQICASALLPLNLNKRVKRKYCEKAEILLSITIYKDDPKIYFKLEQDNHVLSHKLCVRINVGSEINQTLSSSAYGQIKRDVKLDDEIVNWQDNNVEKPICIETFDGFVKSYDDDLVVISSFGKEYQAHHNYIDLTVYATTGELGKSDLVNRPGRASGDVTKKGHIKIDTPKAQCLGSVTFDFGLVLGNNDYFTNMHNVQEFRMKTISYQVQEINKFEGRIDNKLMPYREEINKKTKYDPLNIKTNAYITSIGIGLNGETIVRGVVNDDHYFNTTLKLSSIDLLGNPRNIEYSKYKIFNYKLEGK